jgi:hypothetical protein
MVSKYRAAIAIRENEKICQIMLARYILKMRGIQRA